VTKFSALCIVSQLLCSLCEGAKQLQCDTLAAAFKDVLDESSYLCNCYRRIYVSYNFQCDVTSGNALGT